MVDLFPWLEVIILPVFLGVRTSLYITDTEALISAVGSPSSAFSRDSVREQGMVIGRPTKYG